MLNDIIEHTGRQQGYMSLTLVDTPAPAVSAPNALELYAQYRQLALTLVNVADASVYYKSNSNDQASRNGFGVHEKFIHNGRSLIDLSVGLLDFPWVAADVHPENEISLIDLYQLADREFNPTTAIRLRRIADFLGNHPGVRIYYYGGHEGTVAVTVEDEFNLLKFNMIVSHPFL